MKHLQGKLFLFTEVVYRCYNLSSEHFSSVNLLIRVAHILWCVWRICYPYGVRPNKSDFLLLETLPPYPTTPNHVAIFHRMFTRSKFYRYDIYWNIPKCNDRYIITQLFFTLSSSEFWKINVILSSFDGESTNSPLKCGKIELFTQPPVFFINMFPEPRNKVLFGLV